MKQGTLFAEPRFRRVCRDVLLPAGLYSPAPLIVEAIGTLTPSDKAVYRAALHHLRGAATSVSVGLDRLAAMTAMSRRSATGGVANLHAAVLVDARQRVRNGRWNIAFAPLDWWLVEHSRKIDPGLIERLKNIYTTESAIIRFVEATQEKAAPAQAAAPETAAPQAAAPEQDLEKSAPPPCKIFQDLEKSAPPPCKIFQDLEKSAPKALTKETDYKASAARAALRPISNLQTPEFNMANAWEDLLGLSGKARTDEQEEADFQMLLDVATDVLAGNLGPVEAAKDVLYTLAHQIGRRPIPARTPLGLFLADGVGKLRIKAMRRTAENKKGVENG